MPRNAQVLGPDMPIDITAFDETNTRVKIRQIVALLQRHGGFGMVGLVGVQSNQFPRALDIARPLREAGIQVVMGGFHVSGCLAMLPEMQADLQAALDIGVTLFAGEAEGRIDTVLRDAAAGTLAPIYNYLDDLPPLEDAPTPFLPRAIIGRTVKHHASFDAGRGCPFQCSFCTIINVQGRKSRRRSPDDVERLIKQHWAEGVRRFFITDDNFARNKDWEAIFDRIIQIRERDRIKVRLIIQVDTLCHQLPNFVAKAARAGVTRVFIGLENINPTNLLAAKKRQNRITEYRQDAARLEAGGRDHLCRLHSGLPGRYAGVDQARHRDHQEGIAARHPGILLPHAAAWVRGPQGAVSEGRLDGPRHEQIRPRACRGGSSGDDPRGVASGLSRRLGHVLHARAHAHDPAPRRRAPAWECTGWRRCCSSSPATWRSRTCIRCKAASSG